MAPLERGEAAEDLRVGGAMAAKRDDRGCLRIRNAAPRELEERQFAHTGVFQTGERRTCENRLARRAMAGHFQKNGVRKARETHGLKLSRAQSQLIQLRKFENRFFAHLRAKQTGDLAARIERLAASPIDVHGRDAAGIRKSALPRGGELRDFRRRDVERFQLLDGVVIHPGGIERFGIQRLHGMAAGDAQCEE